MPATHATGRPLTGEPLSTTLARPGAYMPRGTMAEPFYDRSPTVGLSGPAGTGKSRLLLEKVHLLMEKYPGARGLITRKTRESLGEAALFTFETYVLPPGHPCLDGPQRSHRQKYSYPNGSEIVVVGLDKPQKIMSTEFDIAYIQEAIECSSGDVEDVSTRLRNGVIPYNQLLFDCNPDKPLHWIYQAWKRGDFPLYFTLHEDNPVLWEEAPPGQRRSQEWPEVSRDGRVGRWTLRGAAYIERLQRLTGARRKRLYEGLWVQAEGAVYTNWESGEGGNIVERPHNLARRRVWSVDFGYVHPLVMKRYAVDGDGRMVMYAELYKTRTLIEVAAVEFLASAGWVWDREAAEHVPAPGFGPGGREPEPLPEAVVCDWDAEGRATFEDKTGLRTEAAYKSISDGIQNMEARLKPAGDGRRRLTYVRDALIHAPDPELGDAMKPQRTVEEFDGYVWDTENGRKKGEVPVGIDDHGMDSDRYACAYVDSLRDEVKAGDVAEGALVNPMVVAVPNSHGRRTDTNGVIEARAGYGGKDQLWRHASARRAARRGR